MSTRPGNGKQERSLARCRDFDFGIEDHGCPCIFGHFEYDDGSCQGLGIIADSAFLMRFLCAVGVEKLRDLEDKACWVTHDHERIYKIEPLFKPKKDSQTRPFVISEWSEWRKSRAPFSAHELLTGQLPK